MIFQKHPKNLHCFTCFCLFVCFLRTIKNRVPLFILFDGSKNLHCFVCLFKRHKIIYSNIPRCLINDGVKINGGGGGGVRDFSKIKLTGRGQNKWRDMEFQKVR